MEHSINARVPLTVMLRPADLFAPVPPGALMMAVWVFACGPEAVAAGPVRHEIRVSLPGYDPAIHEAYVAEQERRRRAADGAESYGVKQGSTESLPVAASEPITLPRIVVHPSDTAARQEPAVQLPRLVVRPKGKDVKPDDFESPAARDERLVKKHLSILDRKVLNRFTLPLFGISKEARARHAEAVEQSARRLTEISELVQLSQEGKKETDEDRKLREAYLDAFVSRPK